jgi:4-hydroxy-2-oxoheptanedioate aldolase
MKRKNVLRELLREGKPSIGTHVHSIWPGIVEVIGHSGTMDYVEFQGEYAPYDLFSLENFGRAVGLFDHMSSMMKIEQEPRTYLATRAVGSGIQNLLFADIRGPEDAREAVASMRPDTPELKGKVGAAMRRDVGYVDTRFDEYIEALIEGVVVLMIEKRSAVERLEEILSVGGIDMVQFGPSDYSINIGRAGHEDHPDVKEAEKKTIETALRMGVAPRVEINDHREAAAYIEMGVTHFCIGWDVVVLHEWCKEQGAALAKSLGR